MSKVEHLIKIPLSALDPPVKKKPKSCEQKLEFFCRFLFLILCGSTIIWVLNKRKIIDLNPIQKFVESNVNKLQHLNIEAISTKIYEDTTESVMQRDEVKESFLGYQWIEKGITPENFVTAGTDGKLEIRVIRAKDDDGNFVTGKISSHGDAYIYNLGIEKPLNKNEVEFLQAKNYSWKIYVPHWNRVYADETETKYVCRVIHKDPSETLKVSGFVDYSGKCKYSYGHLGYESYNFEVLSV